LTFAPVFEALVAGVGEGLAASPRGPESPTLLPVVPKSGKPVVGVPSAGAAPPCRACPPRQRRGRFVQDLRRPRRRRRPRPGRRRRARQAGTWRFHFGEGGLVRWSRVARRPRGCRTGGQRRGEGAKDLSRASWRGRSTYQTSTPCVSQGGRSCEPPRYQRRNIYNPSVDVSVLV
jgi:hypothetical protein